MPFISDGADDISTLVNLIEICKDGEIGFRHAAEIGRRAPALEHGVDVLLNPGAPASMRLRADAVRNIAADA